MRTFHAMLKGSWRLSVSIHVLTERCCFFCWRVLRMLCDFWNVLLSLLRAQRMILFLCRLLRLLVTLRSFQCIFLQGGIRLFFGSYTACWQCVGLMLLSWGGKSERSVCLAVWQDHGFHVRRAGVPNIERVSVEDLVKWVGSLGSICLLCGGTSFLGWFWRWSSMGYCTRWCSTKSYPHTKILLIKANTPTNTEEKPQEKPPKKAATEHIFSHI